MQKHFHLLFACFPSSEVLFFSNIQKISIMKRAVYNLSSRPPFLLSLFVRSVVFFLSEKHLGIQENKAYYDR